MLSGVEGCLGGERSVGCIDGGADSDSVFGGDSVDGGFADGVEAGEGG